MKTKSIEIEKLIHVLEKLKDRGIDNVQIKGTLFCEEDGNRILASTEKQM